MPSNPTYIFEDLEAGGSLNSVIPNPSVIEVDVPILPGVAVAPSAFHSDLSGRSSADQHPISAITDLQAALDAAAGGGGADHSVDLFVSDADLSGGSFSNLTSAAYGSLSRASLVGVDVAVISGDDVTSIWTVTASGPCTEGDTVEPGDTIAGSSDGLFATALAPLGTVTSLVLYATKAQLDALESDTADALATKGSASTVASHETALQNMKNEAQSPYAAWLHNGDLDDDGVDDFLEVDPAEVGLEGKAGGTYEGLQVYRPTASTISGVTYPADITGVIFLANQTTTANNGAWEFFHDLSDIGYVQADVESGGVLFEDFGITDLDVGPFAIRTVTWNYGWRDEAGDIGYRPIHADTIFIVSGGDNQGLWVTTDDGMDSNAVPLGDRTPLVLLGTVTTASEAIESLTSEAAKSLRVIKQADETRSNNTQADDAELTLPLPASKVCVVDVSVIAYGGTTPDIAVDLSVGTATLNSSVVRGHITGWSGATGANIVNHAEISPGTPVHVGVGNTVPTEIIIKAVITTTTATTVTFRWAQNTTSGSTTVRKGSMMTLRY